MTLNGRYFKIHPFLTPHAVARANINMPYAHVCMLCIRVHVTIPFSIHVDIRLHHLGETWDTWPVSHRRKSTRTILYLLLHFPTPRLLLSWLLHIAKRIQRSLSVSFPLCFVKSCGPTNRCAKNTSPACLAHVC